MVFMHLAPLCGTNAGFGDEVAEANAGTGLKDAASRVDFFEAPQAGHFPA